MNELACYFNPSKRDESVHVEGSLGKIVVLAVKDLLERAEGILEGNELTLDTSEDLKLRLANFT